MKNMLDIESWGRGDAIKAAVALVGGYLSGLIGGVDRMVQILFVLVCLDYLTGVLKAIITKHLSSEIGGKGIAKKAMIGVIVVVANLAQEALGGEAPIRNIVIVFYIANEALSIIENGGAMGLKYPKKLLDILEQLRDDSNEGKLPPRKEPPEGVS